MKPTRAPLTTKNSRKGVKLSQDAFLGVPSEWNAASADNNLEKLAAGDKCPLESVACFATDCKANALLVVLFMCLSMCQGLLLRRTSAATSTLFRIRGGAKRPKRPKKPLWSGGVRQEDVDQLVEACLQDPDINIASIPDWLERQMYRSTITLVLNAVHRGLNGIHGRRLWKHEFQVYRLPRRRQNLNRALKLLAQHSYEMEAAGGSDDHVLELVADRLLQNKSINQPLIPDFVERQLYVNCLKIVMRVLDLLAVSFRITLCGHEVQMRLKPCELSREEFEEAAFKRMSTTSGGVLSEELTFEQMKDVARVMAATDQRSFWKRWSSPAHNELIAQLHATVYCLILGVLDDLLEHTELQVLSDRIEFDLIPASEAPKQESHEGTTGETSLQASPGTRPASMAKASAMRTMMFWMVGVGVGYALHAVVDQHFPLLHLSSGIAEIKKALNAVWQKICSIRFPGLEEVLFFLQLKENKGAPPPVEDVSGSSWFPGLFKK